MRSLSGDKIDESVLRDLVERTVAGGVHGLVPNVPR